MEDFQFDHEYINQTVSGPLVDAMTQLAIRQPANPIEYLGEYLLNYSKMEKLRQERNKHRSETGMASTVTLPLQNLARAERLSQEVEALAKLMDDMMLAEKHILLELEDVKTMSELYNRFLIFLCHHLHAEEALMGKKCIDQNGTEVVQWIASSRPMSNGISTSVAIDQWVSEEDGITFDAFKEVEGSIDESSNDVNTPSHRIPHSILVENVLREQRLKYYGIPKLGAYLTRALPVKSLLHPNVISTPINEISSFPEVNLDSKEVWLVFSADTMGQARCFTKIERDAFERVTQSFISTIENTEKKLLELDVTRRKETEDQIMKDFASTYANEIPQISEKISLETQSLPENVKTTQEIYLRAKYITNFMVKNIDILSLCSLAIIPFKESELSIFAAALVLLGVEANVLYNPVTKAFAWEKISPLLEKTKLQEYFELFTTNFNAGPLRLNEKDTEKIKKLNDVGPDGSNNKEIFCCFQEWISVILALSDQIEADRKAAEEAEAALAAGNSEETE